MGRGAALAAAIDGLEFGAAQQARLPRQSLRRAHVLLYGSEPVTALTAPRGENFAASLGLHARAKSVRLVAAPHLWLKRTLRQRKLLRARLGRPRLAALLLEKTRRENV